MSKKTGFKNYFKKIFYKFYKKFILKNLINDLNLKIENILKKYKLAFPNKNDESSLSLLLNIFLKSMKYNDKYNNQNFENIMEKLIKVININKKKFIKK